MSKAGDFPDSDFPIPFIEQLSSLFVFPEISSQSARLLYRCKINLFAAYKMENAEERNKNRLMMHF